jgi:transposase InsO family protein
VKFDFIAAENARKSYDVEFMCRMLGVSRSGYYARQNRGITQRQRDDLALVPLIHAEHKKYPRGCGSRTIVGALRAQGHQVGRRRAKRLMSEENLCCRLKRRHVVTTQSKNDDRVAPNLLDRSFEPTAPNRAWAGDITYLPTKDGGWAYLAALLDVGTRKVVGWAVGPTIDYELVLTALERAVQSRKPPHGLIHHSDRGVQYTCHAFQAALAERGIVCSMSRKGNCWDNALVESFFSTLKRELPNETPFEDWRDAERAVFKYIEAHYNTHRRHSALGYLSPNEYEHRAA